MAGGFKRRECDIAKRYAIEAAHGKCDIDRLERVMHAELRIVWLGLARLQRPCRPERGDHLGPAAPLQVGKATDMIEMLVAVEQDFHILDPEARLGNVCFDISEEHTSELQSLMPISYAVFFLKKK